MTVQSLLNVSEALAGRQVLFIGSTGFLGKVALSMLLHRYGGQLKRIHVVVRRGSSPSAERRFFDRIVTSEAFKPLWELHRSSGGLDFLRDKCRLYDGDITRSQLGLSARQLEE